MSHPERGTQEQYLPPSCGGQLQLDEKHPFGALACVRACKRAEQLVGQVCEEGPSNLRAGIAQ